MAEKTQEKGLTIEQYTKDMTGKVWNQILDKQSQGMALPRNYIPQNALYDAMYKIKTVVDKSGAPALSVCSPASVENTLVQMLTKGLNPAKDQCYFIVRGTSLDLFISYFGYVHMAKSSNPEIEDVFAEVVYEKDKFAYKIVRGAKNISLHEQSPENIDLTKIKGAYCTVIFKDGHEVSEYMTMQQIKNSWTHSQTKGESMAHKLSPEMMCKRTVTRRLCVTMLKVTDDSALIEDQIENIDKDIDALENSIDITPDGEIVESIPEKVPERKEPEVAEGEQVPLPWGE